MIRSLSTRDAANKKVTTPRKESESNFAPARRYTMESDGPSKFENHDPGARQDRITQHKQSETRKLKKNTSMPNSWMVDPRFRRLRPRSMLLVHPNYTT